MQMCCSEDIIRYIMLQQSGPFEGAPKPRFSLYLSSQLMYGVVKVYDQQHKFLFGVRNFSIP
jgi:meiotic recombination protein REC8